MSFSMEKALAVAEEQRTALLAGLNKLVVLESPTGDRAGVNAACSLVEDLSKSLIPDTLHHVSSDFGDVLEMRFAGPGARPVLLLGHLDTVWEVGTLRGMPWRVADGRAWGPGVLDMKAGVMMALTALKVLQTMGIERSVTMLLNSDEEAGSPFSRGLTERIAVECSAALVLEPAQGLAYKTARKGVGHYVLDLEGVGAHAGVDFEKGHSAVREVARLVEKVSDLTNLSGKRTVNCGVLYGGTRANVVAATAGVEVDVRVATAEDGKVVDALLRSLKCEDPMCRLTVRGGINRPPMERTGGTVALFERARGLAAQIGIVLEEASTGGGSDGNFTSALGVPTLDGMGAVGEGAHAAHESVILEYLAPRTALLAGMIALS